MVECFDSQKLNPQNIFWADLQKANPSKVSGYTVTNKITNEYCYTVSFLILPYSSKLSQMSEKRGIHD